MSATNRWDRLSDTLTGRGIEHRMVKKAYPGGVSTRIYVSLPGNERVIVADGHWHDMWTGWHVYRENAAAICTDYLRRSKKRGEVADAVLKAVTA